MVLDGVGKAQASELHSIELISYYRATENYMLNRLLSESFFRHQSLSKSATAKDQLKSLIYSSYKKPQNHLNISQFLEKFKCLENDLKNEKITLTGN